MVSSGSRCEVWQVRIFRLRWLQDAITRCVRLLLSEPSLGLMAAVQPRERKREVRTNPMEDGFTVAYDLPPADGESIEEQERRKAPDTDREGGDVHP